MPKSLKTLHITGHIDGGNPRHNSHIRQESEGVWRIKPEWELETGNSKQEPGESRKTTLVSGRSALADGPVSSQRSDPASSAGRRFAVMIENTGAVPVDLTVKIDWTSDRFMAHKGVYYFNEEGEPDWDEIQAEVRGAVAELRLRAPVGVSWLSLSPMYNYSRYLAFVDALRERESPTGRDRCIEGAEVDVRLVGKSAEDREIWLLETSNSKLATGDGNNTTPVSNQSRGDDPVEPVLFIARTWGCETAGNYMIEGMIRFLLSGEPEAARLVREFSFHFLPMVNPDGVYNGLERRPSRTSNTDLERDADSSDPAHALLAKTLRQIRPVLFVNLHDWLPPDRDGLICSDEIYARKLPELLPLIGDSSGEDASEWYSDGVRAPLDQGDAAIRPTAGLECDCTSVWRSFCKKNFKSRSITVEFPWRGRTVEDMRQLGVGLLKSVCLVRLYEKAVASQNSKLKSQ